jgi:hypothetical protein
MGHLFHGASLAFPSQQLRYGFLTMRGSTGGVSREASMPDRQSSRAAEAAVSNRIVVINGFQGTEVRGIHDGIGKGVCAGGGAGRMRRFGLDNLARDT